MIYLAEVPSAKYRQRTSEGRITDKVIVGGELTHPYDVANDSYESLPRNMDVLLPLGDGMLNRLIVREYNGKYLRQTASREDILAMLNPDAMWDEGQVVAPETRNIVENKPCIIYSDNEQGNLNANVSVRFESSDGTKLHFTAYDKPSERYKCILGAQTTLTRNALRLYQTRNISSPQNSYGHQDNPFDHIIATNGVRTTGAGAAGTESCTLGKNELLQDLLALKWMHSSATSFVFQFREDLKALASQTQYLSNELYSFYQKGFKGDFLRSQNDTQIWLIASLVEFGAAIRRHHWTYNGKGTDANSMRDHNEEVINPFYVRLSLDTDTSEKQLIEIMPWWVSSLYDRGHFDYEGEEHPDIKDIYREDLFIGLKTLLEASSLEQGMAWKGYSMPWMDFFDKFETGTLPDLYDENSLDAMRTLWYTGRGDVESYRKKKTVVNNAGSVPYFSNFIDKVSLNKQAPLDLEIDLAELDKMPCMTGSRFKEGMQMLGPFGHSCYHRKARFEDRHTDVTYYPMMFMRPVVTMNTHAKVGTDFKGIGDNNDADEGQARLDAMIDFTAADAAVSNYFTTAVEWIGTPSIETGWATLAEGVLHRCGHPFRGYGSTMIGESLVSLRGTGPQAVVPGNPLGITLTNAALTDTNAGAGTHLSWSCHGGMPLSHKAYWSPGVNSILPSLFTVLHDVYAAWQNRTSGLFQRSELKSMMSWQSINLKSEMTMTTPNAKLSKYGKEIFNFMVCASTGWDVGYAVRTVDRKLDSQLFHNREGEPDLLVAPWDMESSGVEDTFSAVHTLGLLSGLFGHSLTSCPHGGTYGGGLSLTGGAPGAASTTTADPYNKTFRGSVARAEKNKQRFNPQVNEFSLFPRVTGVLTPVAGFGFAAADTANADRAHNPGRASFVRVAYDGPISRDGAERKIKMTEMVKWIVPDATDATQMASDQTVYTAGSAKDASWFAVAEIPTYNFLSEIVMSSPNDAVYGSSLEFIPGHRQLYRLWRLDHTTDLAGSANIDAGVKSLCSSFGVSGVPLVTGSTVADPLGNLLEGFALGSIPALTYTSELTGNPVIPTGWDNNQILQYFEQRLGTLGAEPSDVRIWTEHAPKLLVYDQDLHDHNEAMLGAILDLDFGVNHPGYITLLSLINYSGDEEYRIEGAYGWAGGVKTADLEAVEASVTADDDYTE